MILLFPSPSHAWTKADTQRQLVYTALHVIDWGQTRYIATHEHIYETKLVYETNPILGKRPSIQEVDIYFASTLVGHAVVSYLLPPKYRAGWQMLWIGVELNQVSANYNIGVNVHF